MSLQNAILGILTYAPMTGYDLSKVFDKTAKYAWTASLSQIYRELGGLEKKGLVNASLKEQEDRPNKKIYTITDDGREMFEKWLGDFPKSFSVPKRDPFMLRLFYGSQLEKDEVIRQLERYIDERKEFEEMMINGKTILANLDDFLGDRETEKKRMDFVYWKIIARRAILSNRTLIDWAKESIDILQQA